MFGRNAAEAPVRGREDPVPPNPFTGRQCTGSRVYSNVAPGFRQGLHDHNVEQVHGMPGGRRKLQVGDAEREVGRENPVYIPSGAVQGIENVSR